MNPKSIGYIKLDGDKLDVNPNYLSNSSDIVMIEKAIDFTLKLLNQDYFRDVIHNIDCYEQLSSNPSSYILDNFQSGYHLIGGSAELIDSNFELNGYSNLFICDASIFDSYPASNIHSSVVLISSLFSSRFLKNNA